MWLRYRILRPPAIAISKLPVYRLKWSGYENAPVSGPFIIVANHQTSVDGLAIAIALKKAANKSPILPWAKREIGRGREGIVGFILWRIFGKITIDRGAEEEAPNAIKESLLQLRKMKMVLVFPEGTRYPRGEVGPFKYGVANLARATPAPILPVAVYRREEDNGVQVKVGHPFFMPNIPLDDEELVQPRSKIEALLIKQLEIAREWGESVGQDKKGMKLLARLIDLINRMIARQHTSFNLLFRMARPEDNEFLRASVLELLPDDWRAVEGPSRRERGKQNILFRE
ncbi:MAG: 1-acyl-sn-glycerol-3-phosphate acyltransferase [Actinobacteria bacterium]|nr:1-acyl-sn-glycerol-3-phosphate acyltransferase [Actinomycetota bacterium]MBU4179712.1 1-acyl-sn-glycerol-3-phosphate acyltransferase [Actinomycetota bacterium]MBU4218029.1 1-acyl-sn-glycerol-3-phosphate acyltransferase [Actinomycetota bacterium]MBU4358886.1 1-acyl-sn-glycerol-3-phosphate acyltransferase [Actinomycetota bacterium]MCG2819898.1 1-acyl-sn-glycerol-3-phosphate acyltransferase [Actinomycetes bacterium]